MVALVIGAHGFLGRRVSDRLATAGWTVSKAGRPEMEVPSDPWRELLAQGDVELVVHCATPASVAWSFDEPARDFAASAGVLSAVLDDVRRRDRPPRVVLLSSAAVYGQPETLPVAEDGPLAPVSPYGFHRAACERLLSEHHELYGLPVLALRIFSAYGEGLRRQLLWDVATRALRDGRVELSGTGAESRDFLHADDVARAVVVAAERGDFRDGRLNVASGTQTTVADVAARLVAQLGDVPVTFDGHQRTGDPTRWQADVSRLDALGFSPSVMLDDGLSRYAAWARQELACR